MKFFKPEVIDQFFEWDSHELFRETNDAYREHLASLEGVLPERILKLSEPWGTKDGLLVRAYREGSNLHLVLRCGDLQMGYYNLELIYLDAEISSEHAEVIREISRTTKAQRTYQYCLYVYELDVTPEGRVVHRMIFTEKWAEGFPWFAITARDLRWQRVPVLSRRLNRDPRFCSNV